MKLFSIKKATLKLTFVSLFSVSAITAQGQSLEENLTSSYQIMDTAQTLNGWMSASCSFDLITYMWPNEAMSNYYAALSKVMISYLEPNTDKKDLFLDAADRYYEKVALLMPDNEETYILAAYIANARLAVDPGNRWKVYGELFDKNIEKAKTINPTNPRIYYLKGIAVFNTPKMFGGGAKNAKEHLEKAKQLYAVQIKSSVLVPSWGEKQNAYFLMKCNEVK